MRKSRIVSLVAVGAISLPLLASTASAVAASPRAAPSIGTQLAELKGSDTVAGDRLGHPVAISGTTAVVGAWARAKHAGRAYVFTKTAFGWTQVAELKGSDTVAGDLFGESVAISGTTVVVGALLHAKGAGRAYVFIGTGAGWTQVAELKGSDTVAGDEFGWSVAVSGTTVVVGSDHGNTGQVCVFTKTASGWKQVSELEGADTVVGDSFSNSVAISGTTAVVGAESHAASAGRAYVFAKTASGWKQTAELEGADTVAGDTFGNSVAISGTSVVVGAYAHAKSAGRAYVFTKTASGWTQAAELKGSDTVANDNFGESVAISGTTAVVGAWLHAKDAGRAYVFIKTGAGWTQAAELKGSDTVASDDFGSSVAISGTTAIVGAAGHANTAGRAYVFEA
jgi:nucleoside-specific outer membrane channel protein Tsx